MAEENTPAESRFNEYGELREAPKPSAPQLASTEGRPVPDNPAEKRRQDGGETYDQMTDRKLAEVKRARETFTKVAERAGDVFGAYSELLKAAADAGAEKMAAQLLDLGPTLGAMYGIGLKTATPEEEMMKKIDDAADATLPPENPSNTEPSSPSSGAADAAELRSVVENRGEPTPPAPPTPPTTGQ